MGPRLWVGCCALALATGCATYTRPAAASRPERAATPDFTPAAIVADQCVVYIRTSRTAADDPQGRCTLIGGGTGVIIDARGSILTSAHVLDGATSVHVHTAGGSISPALRVELCERLDLALIRVDPACLAGLRPAVAADTSAGPVCAVAAVTGAAEPVDVDRVCVKAQLRTGRIMRRAVNLQEQIDSARHRTYTGLIETDIAIEPGYSGGPLLTPDGQLVGIDIARARVGAAPRAYAIPWTAQTRREIESLLLASR